MENTKNEHTKKREQAKAFVKQIFDLAVQQGLTCYDMDNVEKIFVQAMQENRTNISKQTPFKSYELGKRFY